MSESSISLLSPDEPALEAPTTPTPPPQPGEHTMRHRSQGLDTHFRKHIHLGPGNFPTVATPRRSLHGAATYSPNESIGTGPALAPTDDMALTHSHGGCILPEATAATSPTGGHHTANDNDVLDNNTGRTGTANPRPAGGRPVPDNDAGTQLDFGFGVAPLADRANRRLAAALCQRLDVEFGATPLAVTPLAGRPRPAPPTVMGPGVRGGYRRPPRLGAARRHLHLTRNVHATRSPGRRGSGGLSSRAQ